MKFHFTGGLDCPEWILSQIPEIAKSDTKDLRLLCLSIVERMNCQKNPMEWSSKELSNLHSSLDAKVLRALKAKIAALSFIFEKSIKNVCSYQDLEKEMLQLGLPSEQVNVLLEIYGSHQHSIINIFNERIQKAPALVILRKDEVKTNPEDSDTTYTRLKTENTDGSNPTELVFHSKELESLRKCMADTTKQIEELCGNS